MNRVIQVQICWLIRKWVIVLQNNLSLIKLSWLSMELSLSKKTFDQRNDWEIHWEKPWYKKRNEIVRQFHSKGVPISTSYRIFNQFKISWTVQRKGRTDKYKAIKKEVKEKVVETVVNEVGISLRKVARKNQISHTSVIKILSEYGLKRVKR